MGLDSTKENQPLLVFFVYGAPNMIIIDNHPYPDLKLPNDQFDFFVEAAKEESLAFKREFVCFTYRDQKIGRLVSINKHFFSIEFGPVIPFGYYKKFPSYLRDIVLTCSRAAFLRRNPDLQGKVDIYVEKSWAEVFKPPQVMRKFTKTLKGENHFCITVTLGDQYIDKTVFVSWDLVVRYLSRLSVHPPVPDRLTTELFLCYDRQGHRYAVERAK